MSCKSRSVISKYSSSRKSSSSSSSSRSLKDKRALQEKLRIAELLAEAEFVERKQPAKTHGEWLRIEQSCANPRYKRRT